MTSAIARAAALIGSYLQLSAEEGRALAPYFRPTRVRAGEVIFAAGQVCTDLVLLSSGLVRVYYLHEGSGARHGPGRLREVNLRLLCPPATVIALKSFIQRAPSEETVQALTDVEGVRFRIADFVDAHPGRTSEHLRRVMAEQHYLSMERRLRMLQWKSASERYAYFVAHMEKPIVDGVPGVHVASYLGVRPESLSRIRKPR